MRDPAKGWESGTRPDESFARARGFRSPHAYGRRPVSLANPAGLRVLRPWTGAPRPGRFPEATPAAPSAPLRPGAR